MPLDIEQGVEHRVAVIHLTQMHPILAGYLQSIARKYSVAQDQAFEILSAGLVLEKPFDEIFQKQWTGIPNVGGGDAGFDAVDIDEQTRTISLFQSKNVATLSENDLMKLITDFDDLFTQDNQSGRAINAKMQAFLAEYKDYTDQKILLTPKLFFIYSGNNDDPGSQNNVFATRFSTRRTGPEYAVLDQAELLRRVASLQRVSRSRVEFVLTPLETNIPSYSRQSLFSFIVGQVTGVSFRIRATQLCELIEHEIATNGSMDTLFTENIRGYLGRNKTNKRITATLRDPSQRPFFPFMNNGLTIICETMTIPASPQANIYNVPIVNPRIVNGLQTTRVLYDIFLEDPSLLIDVYVTVKVYESRDQGFTDLITEATNTQASINYKDQISNKRFNVYAHTYFAGKGVNYVSKRGDFMQADDLAAGLIDSVNSETVLKFWYATFNKDPHTAKVSQTSLLENIFIATKGESIDTALNDLFSGDVDSPLYQQLFLAFQIQQLVAQRRQRQATDASKDYLLHADELISYGIFEELSAADQLPEPTLVQLEAAYITVQSRVEELVNAEKENRGDTYSHTKYFKSDSIVQDYNQSRRS